MGKTMDNIKKNANKFMTAYDGEVSNLIDNAADLVRDMSKN